MSQASKYQPYSGEEILQYIEGKMPAAEMRRLELAALDDPFLQDAIDGYRLEIEKRGKDSLLPYLHEVLTQNPVGKNEPARVIPFFRMGIFKWAVAALLIVGAGLLWFNLNDTNQKPSKQKASLMVKKQESTDSTQMGDVAITTVPRMKSTENIAPGSTRTMEDDIETSLAKSEKKQTPAAKTFAGNQLTDSDKDGIDDKFEHGNAGEMVSPSVASARTRVPQTVTNAENNFAKSYQYYQNDSNIIAANSKPPAAKKAQLLRETISGKVEGVKTNQNTSADFRNSFGPNMVPNEWAGKFENNNTHFLAGKTIDKEKFPLDHVVIAVKGDTIKTVSDELGRFSLKLPDSVATVVAYGVGIKTKEFQVNSNAGKVELELTPAESSLSEVVISGYALNKKKAGVIELDLDTTEAAPSGGWQNFERYVMQNRKIKPGAKKTAVVVSIEIEESGKVGAMEIIESGGNAFDKEAMRLLKEGPTWINKTKQKVAFAKVTIVL